MNIQTSKTVVDYKNNEVTISVNEKINLICNGYREVPKRLHCESAIINGFTNKKIKIYVESTQEKINIRHDQFLKGKKFLEKVRAKELKK